ncbi:MAG: DUF2141 domain-containing protein [Pacificimonas sp.]
MKKFLAISTVSLALAACGGEPVADPDTDMDTAVVEDDMMADPATDDMMATDEAMVSVTINGIVPGPGQVLVALQSEGEFAQAAGTYTKMMPATMAAETVTFEDVEPGMYAAAVVHDTNENGEIDMGETGPTEGWGLSGAAQAGAPEFGPASFEVGELGGNADVTLTYPQ